MRETMRAWAHWATSCASRVRSVCILTGLLGCLSLAAGTGLADQRPRLAVLTDIGGDPDDQQSLIRLMVYVNEFQIEALIASASGTPGELDQSITRADLIHEIIDAYAKVLPNLKKNASGWPAAEALRTRVFSGNPQRGREHVGQNHDTQASEELIRLIDQGTQDNPLNIAIWGGQTDLAQALYRVHTDRDAQQWKEFVKRLRVYDIADQDGLAEWMAERFRGLHYILSKAPPGQDKRRASFRGMYLTGDQNLTSHDWIEANVRSLGPLGGLYPTRTWTAPNPHGCMKEGDTPSWFFFLQRGGNDPQNPERPGWGGQFRKTADGWFRDLEITAEIDPRESVSQWRPAFQKDFAQRMRWCEE